MMSDRYHYFLRLKQILAYSNFVLLKNKELLIKK